MDGDSVEPARLFRPESFFLGRTEGWGVAKGPFGHIVRRCRIQTEGRLDEAYQAIHFDELFAWDDGGQEEWRWAMRRGMDGRYVAAEALVGSGIEGRYDGCDYVLSFRRPAQPKGPRFRFVTRFTLLAPDVAMKSVRLFLFGVPIASMVAFHRQVD